MFGWLRTWWARRQDDEARCAALVVDLVSRDRAGAWRAYQALLETGPQSVGPLIAALSDQRFHDPPTRLTNLPPHIPHQVHRLGKAGRLLAGMGHLPGLSDYRRRLSGRPRDDASHALSELSEALDRGHGSALVLSCSMT